MIHPACKAYVLDTIADLGNIGKRHRGAILIGDDYVAIIVAGEQLVVGIDLIVLCFAVQRSLCGVDARARKRGPQLFETNAIVCQGRRIHLNADGGFLAATDCHQSNSTELRDLRGEPRIGQVLHL